MNNNKAFTIDRYEDRIVLEVKVSDTVVGSCAIRNGAVSFAGLHVAHEIIADDPIYKYGCEHFEGKYSCELICFPALDSGCKRILETNELPVALQEIANYLYDMGELENKLGE